MTSSVLTLVIVLLRACGVGARRHFAREFMRRAIVLKSYLASIRLALDAKSCGGTRKQRFLSNAAKGTPWACLHSVTTWFPMEPQF